MSASISTDYRIITAVCKEVLTGEITICAEQCGIIRIYKSANRRIIKSGLQIIEPGLSIEVVALLTARQYHGRC